MGLLPLLTAAVLIRHVNARSVALRERARLSIILAALDVIVMLLVLNRLLGWGWSAEWLVIPFGISLVLVDLASGAWLYQYVRGRFGSE
jgi:hypothetical protein